MLVELWGASNVLGLTLPGTPLGYIFLLIETVLLIGAIFLLSSIFSARFMQKWQWTVSLSIAWWQPAMMRDLGCDFLQGYHFGKPCRVDEL